jgi:hypothetical protein
MDVRSGGAMNFKMEDIAKILLPMLVSAIIWLLNSVGSFNERLVKIEGKMPALITNEGVPTDSPISAERRAKMREEIYREIFDIHVRVKLLEERDKK